MIRALALPHRVTAAVTTCVIFAGLAEAQSISSIGVLPPSGTFTTATAISGDGRVVTGWGEAVSDSGTAAGLRWTGTGGLSPIGTLLVGPFGDSTLARGINGDGAVIVGGSPQWENPTLQTQLTYRAFRWTADGMQSLGTLPGDRGSEAYGVSNNGTVVVGNSFSTAGLTRAFRWTSGGMTNLGTLAGGSESRAYAVSGNALAITGVSASSDGNRAYRWTAADGMVSIGALAGRTYSTGNAISADGSAIVGFSGSLNNNVSMGQDGGPTDRAFLWTTGSGMYELPLPVSSPFVVGSSTAYAISGDGSVVGGRYSSLNNGTFSAFIWTPGIGSVDLNTYLPTLGFDLSGWTLTAVRGISADGSAMTGDGYFNGVQVGFVVTGVPTPGATAILGLAGMLAARRRR